MSDAMAVWTVILVGVSMVIGMGTGPASAGVQIGWAQTDITPSGRVLLRGQFYARIAEKAADPLTATVLVLDGGDDHAVLVSCDLISIVDQLRDEVRERLGDVAGLDPNKVILNATHTHCTPILTDPREGGSLDQGLDLNTQRPEELRAFIADRIAEAVKQAWAARQPGRIAFGLGQAVVGRHRLTVNHAGVSRMYGNTNTPEFRHMVGYEDHSVGVLATRNSDGRLTGLIVNVACPSQVDEHAFEMSADYWHETREELRHRLGDEQLFILPQCAFAGDQSPRTPYAQVAENRMMERAGLSTRARIARDIADAVERVLAILGDTADADTPLRHHVELLPLPMIPITPEMLATAQAEADKLRAQFEEQMRSIEADPAAKDNPRWYVAPTRADGRMSWNLRVVSRHKLQQASSELPSEIHVIRLGDITIATVPFEYYVDYGIQIKARSRGTQTFLVQLAGSGTYLSTERAMRGGGYGALPASNAISAEGGQQLAERIIEVIGQLWND